ncbi:type II toxin-antitoxin system mRNA interferase toxin, RelE/StbE family [Patescibacteria group bacterium]|nr:type II toxin-antitoxin system mRNA interferase toxin, RelE/StbE family [Patescibacteria group bacterium]
MALTIFYAPQFKRDYKKLSTKLQTELKERGKLFQEKPFHPLLKTHKLTGKLDGIWAFSIDIKHRILFQFKDKDSVVLLRVGDHSVYRNK